MTRKPRDPASDADADAKGLRAAIKVVSKAREALRDAQDCPERVEYRVLAEDADVMLVRARSTAAALMSGNRAMPLICGVFSERHHERMVLGNMPRTGAGKHQLACVLRLLILGAPVTAYYLVSEAWFAHYDAPPHREMVLPSDRPDRKEAVLITIASATYHRLAFFHTMRRGRAVTLRAFNDTEPGQLKTENPVLGNLFDFDAEDGKILTSVLDELLANKGESRNGN